MWQLTKAHGVTGKEQKMHVICYITYIYLVLPPHIACNTRWIFKRSSAGVNSNLYFPETGCLIKTKELSRLTFTSTWGNKWIHAYLKDIGLKWRANRLVQNLNWGQKSHFLRWWPSHKHTSAFYVNKSLFHFIKYCLFKQKILIK